ncbi:TPA: lysis protein [Klebsiella pneumoniae subsp. pneumoniae]|nr:hypothetical protein [Klebsiella quasipneumoniae]HCI8313680.1 lysis protein [Klebsiella pneumoniae]HCI8699216.1 lysis protein [Klebsiella pneumoniae]HDT3425854.1 lysis protein [Klebsiella pneumoniae subsp. pneumoniae]HDU5174030.1 lysis protein [Klebsiella pneumoniae subsp. pneumoniae]
MVPLGSYVHLSGLCSSSTILSANRLTDSAERDYWRLRTGIATITGQVGYLLQYIKEQCLH